MAMYLGDDIPRMLQSWRDFMPESPDNLRWGISLTMAPDSEDVPSTVRGLPVANASALWAGDFERGRRYVDRVLSFRNPVALTKEVIPFLKLQTMADSEFPMGGATIPSPAISNLSPTRAFTTWWKRSAPSPLLAVKLSSHTWVAPPRVLGPMRQPLAIAARRSL